MNELTLDPSLDPSLDPLTENAAAQNPSRKLAYLLSIYPAPSHTFFLNEIAELRKLGFRIDVASINRPVRGSGADSAIEIGEKASTFYLKAMNRGRIALVLLRVLFTRPGVVARGVRAAFQLGGWNFAAICYALLYLAEGLLLGDWLRRRGHHHLHIHFGGPVATVGMLTAAAWRISYSLTIHGPEEFYDVDAFYLRRKVAGARFVICISDYCRSQVMKVSPPEHWSKLHVVRLGVDPLVFAPAPKAPQPGPIELVCVGRLVPAKGHLVLLRVFCRLVRNGYDVRLRIVGDGSERHAMEWFIAAEKLMGRVILEGARTHQATREAMATADVFVLASFAEGLPVALMEAMAMEIACVSTFVAGIPELIRDGVDGLLVAPSAEDALFTALERLICDADLRRRLAVAGRARVLEFYHLQDNVRFLAETLRRQLPLPEFGP